MFDRREINGLSAGAATALALGVLVGAWASPPSYLARPVVRQEPQPVFAEDPNLARYRQVIAEQGGAQARFIVQVSQPSHPRPGPDWRDEDRRLEAEIAREEAAVQERWGRWEAERLAWLETRHSDSAERGAYLPPSGRPVDIPLDAPEVWPTERATAIAIDDAPAEHDDGTVYGEP